MCCTKLTNRIGHEVRNHSLCYIMLILVLEDPEKKGMHRLIRSPSPIPLPRAPRWVLGSESKFA